MHETSSSVIFDYAQNGGVRCLPKKSFERSRTTLLVVVRKTCYRWRRRAGKLIAPNTFRRIPALIDCRQTRTPAINNDCHRSIAIVQNVFRILCSAARVWLTTSDSTRSRFPEMSRRRQFYQHKFSYWDFLRKNDVLRPQIPSNYKVELFREHFIYSTVNSSLKNKTSQHLNKYIDLVLAFSFSTNIFGTLSQ